jgi:hypothetical protein
MTPSIRKLALTAHIAASVGWLGALIVFFAHALASLISSDEELVRGASLAMGLTAWFVIMPLSLATLVTGLMQALGTAWGLLRHYWVLSKLLLTAVATIVLLLKLEPISHLANVAAQTTFSAAGVRGLQTSLLIHAAGGLLLLLTAVVLAVYKPAGITPYGLRKALAAKRVVGDADVRLAIRLPGWVRVFGVAVAVFALVVLIMVLVGGHGPGAH